MEKRRDFCVVTYALWGVLQTIIFSSLELYMPYLCIAYIRAHASIRKALLEECDI